MEKVFWLIPERVAGRPGPDLEPWDPSALRRGGIGAILSVNHGAACYPEDLAQSDITYACVPLSDSAPPLPGDDELCLRALPAGYDFVEQRLEEGRAVL